MYETLAVFQPKPPKHETLTDLFRNIKKEQNKKDNGLCEDKNNADRKRPLESFEGFKTAKQYLECKKIKLDKSQTTLGAFFKTESEVRTNVNISKHITEESGIHETVEVSKSETVDNTEQLSGIPEVNEEAMDGDKGKSKNFKMLFGDESDTEEADTPNKASVESNDRGAEKHMHIGETAFDNEPEDDNKDSHEEQSSLDNRKSHSNKSSDYKHSKKKHEDRKRKFETKSDESDDKKKFTSDNTEGPPNKKQNGACRSESSSENPENKNKRPRLKKSEIGTLVVKLLTPAYAERRFDSRDTFKSMARTISHALLDKGTNYS